MKYDDASWHYGGQFPKDLPQEAGGTHIGMFLAWAIHNHLESEFFTREFSEELQAVRQREMTGRDFLFAVCDEKLVDDALNAQGNAFAKYYYEDNDKKGGLYLNDCIAALLVLGASTVYHVADTWENYDTMADMIGRRFAGWKDSQR